MQKIKLDNIKVTIFDFDNILAIHKDEDFAKHRRESEEKRLGYYLNAYNNPNTFYENIEPCVKSVVIYNFIDKNYENDIEILSTTSQKLKINGVKIIQRINACNLDVILFVDDIKENVIRLNDIDVCSLLSNEIDSLLGGVL